MSNKSVRHGTEINEPCHTNRPVMPYCTSQRRRLPRISRTATSCNALHYSHCNTATHCNTLHHSLTLQHCNALQHTAPLTLQHCNALQHGSIGHASQYHPKKCAGDAGETFIALQHAAPHCNADTATHCTTLQNAATPAMPYSTAQRNAREMPIKQF